MCRNFSITAAAACLLALIGLARAAQPNIIHIIADDLGWGDVGYHGSEIRTPRIDQLAAESVVLNHFYVAPICSPTRAGCLTGRYPFRYGMWGSVCSPTSRNGLPPREVTVPEMLAQADYADRVLMGKWHLGLASELFHPLRQGFTRFYGHLNGAIDYFSHERYGEIDWHRDYETLHEEGYSTDLLGKAACDFIRAQPTGRPFYLMLAFNAPHSPVQAKSDDLASYGFDPSGPRAPNTDAGLAKREGAPAYGAAGKGNTIRQTFAAMTTDMDRNIGLVLDTLEKAGLRDDTLVIFHSDNGADPQHGGSNRPLRGNKFSTWEGGTRVVGMVRWPHGFAGGRTLDTPVAYIDLLPTIASAAGTNPPADVDGLDLLPLLRGEKSGADDRAILLGEDTVVSGVWKLKGKELFNLHDDPYEKQDLSQRQPDERAKLKSHLAKFNRISGPATNTQLPMPAIWPPADWKLPPEPAQ